MPAQGLMHPSKVNHLRHCNAKTPKVSLQLCSRFVFATNHRSLCAASTWPEFTLHDQSRRIAVSIHAVPLSLSRCSHLLHEVFGASTTKPPRRRRTGGPWRRGSIGTDPLTLVASGPCSRAARLTRMVEVEVSVGVRQVAVRM